MEKEKRIIDMKKVYYFGKDSSIYESLESIIKTKKKFEIKKLDIKNKRNLQNSILILDDSIKEFLKLSNFFLKNKENNIIITTRKENISLPSLQNLRIFIKPIKVLDLYKEIITRIKKSESSFKIVLNKPNLSIINPKGKNLKLTEKEFMLIELLLSNNEKPLSKKFILYSVWGIDQERVSSLNTRVLETLISRIRKKIRSVKMEISITKNKNGYMLL